MTYKLEVFIEKIKSPVICDFGNEKIEFADGMELTRETFDKYWLIHTIQAQNDKIILIMKENDKLNETVCNESFF